MRTIVAYRDKEIGFIRQVLGEEKNVTWYCSFCQDSFAWSPGSESLLRGVYSAITSEQVKPIVFDRAPFQVVLSDGNVYDFCMDRDCVKFKALLVALDSQNQTLSENLKDRNKALSRALGRQNKELTIVLGKIVNRLWERPL